MENIVAICLGKVIKTRTVQRRPEAERWSSNVIDFLQATPQKLVREGDVEPTGVAVDVEEIDTGEAQAEAEAFDPVAVAAAQLPRPRRPWLSRQQRFEF